MKGERRQAIIADRLTGLSCQQVANKHGVSRQYVSQCCVGVFPKYFHKATKEGCVYRNLRKFINENRITKTELVRRCGLTAHGSNLEYLERFMKGQGDPRKSYIDRLLKVTGLSYEELFSKEEER